MEISEMSGFGGPDLFALGVSINPIQIYLF